MTTIRWFELRASASRAARFGSTTLVMSTCLAACGAAIDAAGDTGLGTPSAAARAVTVEPTARVIVRFVPGSPDPTDAVFLERLAARAGVGRIEAIRPMSGGAFVMRVACTDPRGADGKDSDGRDACARAVARLGATDPVIGIEVDSRETHQ